MNPAQELLERHLVGGGFSRWRTFFLVLGGIRIREHAEAGVHDDLVESAMRPVALGRKNWLHIGDEKAGPKIAAIMSVLATCRRLGIHPRDYLSAVLPKLGRTLTSEVHRLTPLAWLRARQSVPAPGI